MKLNLDRQLTSLQVKRTFLTFVPIALAAGQALATPTLYPPDISFLASIHNPTSSNLVADDRDSRTIYVMPPNEGYSRVTGLHTQSASMLFCRNLSSLARSTGPLEDKIAALSNEMGDQQSRLDQFDRRIAAAQAVAAQYVDDNHLQELTELDTQIDNIKANIQGEIQQLDKCTQSCAAMTKQISIEQKQLATMTRARADYTAQHFAAVRAYDRKKAAVQAVIEQKNSVLQNYQIVIDALNKANGQLLDLFARYGAMEGARANIEFRSSWNANVATLRNLNPGLNFALINTENAHVYPGILGVAGMPSTLTTVIGYEAPGASTTKDGSIALPNYPATMDGNVVLTLLGACPIVYPEMFTLKPGVEPGQQKFGMFITYEFPAAMKLQMRATYNMYKLYSLLKQSGSSGGLFSSHSWSSTEERNFFRDGFSVDWTSQDPQNQISDEQRIAMEREVRNDLYSRLYALAVPQTPNKVLLISAEPPPAHGAIVVADSLANTCPGNEYCVAGSMILRGLDAIFGSSSTSASYTHIEDAQLTEEWSLSKVVMKPWVTSYQTK